jgi:O-antigen/teichoic acid export membrane protein
MLGKEDFGRYGLLSSTVITFGSVAGASMAVTSTKFLAQYRIKDPARAGRLTGLCWLVSAGAGLLMASGMFFWADFIAKMIGDANLEPLLQIVAPVILIAAIIGAQKGILAGFEQFQSLAIINIVIMSFNLPLMIGGTWWFGLKGAMSVIFLINLLNLSINSFYLRRSFAASPVSFTLKGVWEERAVLLSFSLPHVMSTLLNAPVVWLATIFLARQVGGIEQVGLFTAATRWRQVLLFLPGVIAQPSVPIIAERLGAGDYRRVTKLILATFGLLSVVCGGMWLLFAVFSRSIMSAFGDGFIEEGAIVLTVILCAAFFQAIAAPFSNLVTSAGHTWAGFAGTILKSTVLLGVAWLLVGYGARGLALAHAAAFLIAFIFITSISAWILTKQKAR